LEDVVGTTRRSSKGRFILGFIVLGVVSLGGLTGAAFWAGNSLDSKAKRLNANLGAADRLGVATSLQDLRVEAERPEQDAREDLLEAYDAWRALSEKERNELSYLSQVVVSGSARAGQYSRFYRRITALPELMEPVRRASVKNEYSIETPEPWNDTEGKAYAQFVREAVRLVGAQAVMYGRFGSLPEAEAYLAGSARLIRHLGAQASFSPMLRRCSAEIEIQRAAMRIAQANSEKTDLVAGMLRRQQLRFGPMPSATDVMRGELALVLHHLGDAEKTGLQKVPAGHFFEDVAKSGVAEIWTRHYRKLPHNPYDQNGAERVLIAMTKEAEETPFYGQYINGYDRMMPMLRDTLTRRRLALLAARALELRAEGKPIEDGSVIGRDGIDPWSGEPLKVKDLVNRTLLLYSVGRDMRDDGGKERETGENASPFYDIRFRLP
jgi:hypothetical protein